MSIGGLDVGDKLPATLADGPSTQSEKSAGAGVAALLPSRSGLDVARRPRLLTNERTRTIVLALADGSRRPSELERLQGIVRSTLFARLGELTALGIVTSSRRAEFPLRVEYQLNESGRRLLANELLIERQERRKLARVGPGVDAALGNLLRLLAPVSRLTTDRQGHCQLVEHEPSGQTHTVRLLVADRRVTVSERARPAEPDVRCSATSETWENALVAGGTHGLQMAGDLVLGNAVIVAFSLALST
jgi:DNA-binding HxlR family transcriptional regulator